MKMFKQFIEEIRSYGFKSTLKAWIERLFYGISWIEANGIDEWLIPELAKSDNELAELYKEYEEESCFFSELLTDKIVDYLTTHYCDFNLEKYVSKLRYIFNKYKEGYISGVPLIYTEAEWINIIGKMCYLFNFWNKIPSSERSELIKLFWKNIFYFWW